MTAPTIGELRARLSLSLERMDRAFVLMARDGNEGRAGATAFKREARLLAKLAIRLWYMSTKLRSTR